MRDAGRNAFTTSSFVSIYGPSSSVMHVGIDTKTSSIVSRIDLGLPGKFKMRDLPRKPAVCRDRTAVGTYRRLIERICSP